MTNNRLHRITLLLAILLTISFSASTVTHAKEATPTPPPVELPDLPIDPPLPVDPVEPTETTPTEVVTEAPTEAPTEEVTPPPVVTLDLPIDPPITDLLPPAEPTEAPPTEAPPTEAPPTEAPPENNPIDETPIVEIDVPTTEPTPDVDDNPVFEDDPVIINAPDATCGMSITDNGDTNPFSFAFAAVDVQNIASYQWDLGDTTTSNAVNLIHTYAGPGVYDVTLTCTPLTGANLVLSGRISIVQPISAQFTVRPGLSGIAPYTVNTSNTSSGAGLTYDWAVTGPENFTSMAAQPSFTFTQWGNYTITLEVTDSYGQVASAGATVGVIAPAPDATFSLSPNAGPVPLAVTVNGIDNNAGPIDTWDWTFTGGTPATATGQGPHSINYATDGTYSITLNYTGPGGGGSITKEVGAFPDNEPVDAVFSYFINDDPNTALIEVCFVNQSEGPVVTSEWTFGDGSPVLSDNNEIVCHGYANEGNVTVRLDVFATDTTITSDATIVVAVTAAPVADFTFTPASPITWNTEIDFTDASTGIIQTWAWDFDNDGVTDSTDENPQDILFTTLGGNIIRLTVTGPGGESTAEATIMVERLEITCDFNGELFPAPGTTQPYTSVVNDLEGRGITYSWQITGPGVFPAESTEDINITWANSGNYEVKFSAVTDDGSSCEVVKTVEVEWPTMTCAVIGNLAPVPDGNNNTYTADVTNIAGRDVTYEWFVDGTSQGVSTANTLTLSSTTPITHSVYYIVRTVNETGDCSAPPVSVVFDWPAVTCGINGQANPVPALPDNPTRSYTYSANVGNVLGRTVTYQWYVDNVLQGETSNQLTLSWAWYEEGPYEVRYEATIDDGNGDIDNCGANRNVNVNVPNLVCDLPNGDATPVINESVTFTTNLNNRYGRNFTARTWDFQQLVGGIWTDVAVGVNNASYTYTFSNPDETYRVRYYVVVEEPTDNCTSDWKQITTAGVGNDFTCDAWAGGDLTPTSPTNNYTYDVTIDNTNNIDLSYTWVLIAPDGTETTLGTNTSTADGNVSSPAFNGSAFTPADVYTLRVDVAAVNAADTTYTCALQETLTSGTLTVDFTPPGDTAVEINEPVCLTNTSTTSHGDINSLTYIWDFGTVDNSLGTQTSTDQQPGCISFLNPGSYTVTLTGTNGSGNLSDTADYVFDVYGSQSIAISTADDTYAPINKSFTAIHQNLTGAFNWTFYNEAGTQIGTRTGETVQFFFTNPGIYSAEVVGSGPLGNNTATMTFELIDVDDIRAAFSATTYGGLAPLDVCFTDRSTGNNITSWAWDFNNDSIVDMSYDDNNIPANICYTYTTPAQSHLVSLAIENNNGLQANATNIIRTYNLVEAGATFTVDAQGGGYFCYTAILDGDIDVVSWEYGDGNNGPAQEVVCHQYGASGTYLVTMHVENGNGDDGEIIREVVVDLTDNTPQPVLDINAQCSADVTASFLITNNGGDMKSPELVTLQHSGQVIRTDASLMLAAGETQTYTVTGYVGAVTLNLLDSAVATQTDCAEPPILDGSSVCAADGTAAFTINNTSSETAADQNYEIRNANGDLIQTGIIQIPVGSSAQVNVSGTYGPLTLTSSGPEGPTTELTIDSDCDTPPLLSISHSCQLDGTAVFTVSNTSDDTAANQPYEIRNANGDLVQSGTLAVPVNSSAQVSVVNTYGQLTFTSSSATQGNTTSITDTSNCDEPPVLTGSADCTYDGTATFSITNSSADSTADQPYTVTAEDGTVIDTGTLNVPPNSTRDIVVIGADGRVTLTSSGPEGPTTELNILTVCDEPPIITGSATCEANGTAVFNITNSSTDLDANQTYTVTDSGGTVVDNGTLTTTANGGTTQILITNVYDLLTFTTSGPEGVTTELTLTTDCDEPPILTGSATCEADGTTVFTITNSSTESVTSQPYVVNGADGTLVDNGSLRIDIGGSIEIRVTDVFGLLTFSTSGPEGITTELNVNSNCDEPPSVSLVTEENDDNGEPPAGDTVTSDGELTSTDEDTERDLTTIETGFTSFLPTLDLTPLGRPDTLLERPAWDSLEIGGAVCVDWLIYHTNMTGNWEVFRLGDGLGDYLAPYNPNLSQGVGENVTDMAPTRSPDTAWVAFTSNRDSTAEVENWELYLARVDNTEIRRVTYNTAAKDIDPAWSPDGRQILFETDRDGNWELYLLDLVTGVETRLTESDASDINASWSPDSSQIVFQSDRDGLWQIYMLDLATGEETRLSDGSGDDHDPAFAFAGDRIAFRTFRDNLRNSMIYTMDAAGDDVQRISDARGMASNHTWAPDDSVIAYQSDLDGDLDIYAYEIETEETRLVTDNDIPDYAPTWYCNAPLVVFTSDVTGDPNIFNTPALPIEAPSILVDEEASQMTTDPADDIYPENTPSEENASREGNVPPKFSAPTQ